MKIEHFIVGFLIIACGLIGILIYQVALQGNMNSMKQIILDEGLAGMYESKSGVICYKANDLFVSKDVVEQHELCHYQVDKDYYHFCQEYYGNCACECK